MGLALERVQRRHDGLDHRGGEALGGLVQDQELVAPDEGAGDGEHLLLAAGEAARRLTLTLGEPGKEREHALELGRPLATVRVLVDEGDAQVLHHGERREELPSLRRVADAQPRDRERA